MTSLHADEAFLSHFQFSHDPFASRVPGFKFFPAQRKPVLGQLHHLARYSQLLLVVSGPEGSGKTLLRQALVASTNKQAVHNLVVSAQGAAGATALLAQIALGLNALQADIGSILSQVEQLALTGREVYLMVDDAEHLSEAALEALLLLAAGNVEGRPHVFLFGDVTLAPRLESLVDDEEQRFHVIELQPYDQDETREYLAQRLEGAGQDIALLSDEQVEAIHLRAQGWPGAINLVAHETLIDTMLAQRRVTQRKKHNGLSVPKKTVLALALVALGVGAAWVIRSGDNPAQDMVVAQLPPAQPDAPVIVTAESLGVAFDGSTQSLPLPMDDPALPLMREPLAQAAGLDESAESADEVIVPEVAPPEAPEPELKPEPEPEPEPEPVSPPPVVPAPVAPAPEPVAVAAPKPAPKPTPKPVAKPPVKAPAAVAKAAVAGDWYAGQAGGHYALQVFGSRSQRAAQDFARQRGDEYHSFKKIHQGKPLYVVTYGTFSTAGAARAAIETLPAQVQAGKPWPRSFAGIAKEIAQAR